MLQVNDITLTRGRDTVIFDGLSMTVHAGQRCALVGRNGAGKTTLFEVLLGKLQPDDGDVLRPREWRLAYMAQEAVSSDRSAVDFVLDGHEALRRVEDQIRTLEAQPHSDAASHELANAYAKLEDLGGYEAQARAHEILSGLGFAADRFDQPHRSFSGGWRIRLQLARTLMAPSELMLLDEPTNHLDLETIVWLEHWLKRYDGTLIFISHDKRFIDQVADHVLHLESRRVATYRGNYTDFERERSLALERNAATRAKQQKQIDEITDFARRFRAKATKAKQVQSRLKRLEKLETIAPVLVESRYEFTFLNPDKLPQPLAHGRDLTLGYDDSPVLENVAFSILPGDRIGVLGVNGAGKSTFLKSLVGDLAPLAGDLKLGGKATVGYFAQQQVDHLELDRTIIATVRRQLPELDDQRIRDYLGGWGFPGDDLERAVGTLSGGEKARLVLALMALGEPAILVMDEPTNHLDLVMRESLALALQQYNGAVVLVSHDRELLDSCVDEFWLIHGGRVRVFEGDLDDYILQDNGRGKSGSGIKAPAASSEPRDRKQARQEAAASRQAKAPLQKKSQGPGKARRRAERTNRSDRRTAGGSKRQARRPEQRFGTNHADPADRTKQPRRRARCR